MIMTMEWTDRRQTGIRSLKVIIGHLLEVRGDQIMAGPCPEIQGIAVGLGPDHPSVPVIPPPPGLFTTTRGLSKYLVANLADQTGQDICGPAGGKGNIQLDGFGRKFFCRSSHGREEQETNKERAPKISSSCLPPSM